MKTVTIGIIIGVPFALISLFLPNSLFRIAHVLFLSLGIVLGLSLIAPKRHSLKMRDSLFSGFIAYAVFSAGSVRTPFISFRTGIFEESGEIVVYTGIQNWICGIFLGIIALYLILLLWFCVLKKITPVQKAGFLGGLVAAIPWTLSGKYGIPSDYDFAVSLLLFFLLALPGFALFHSKEFSLRKGIVGGAIGWSIWVLLVTTAILYTGPRMWIFPDNWDFLVLKISYLARYLPVWILLSSVILVFGKQITRKWDGKMI